MGDEFDALDEEISQLRYMVVLLEDILAKAKDKDENDLIHLINSCRDLVELILKTRTN
jgi:hypothetical protein